MCGGGHGDATREVAMMWTDERLARAALTAAVEPGSVTTANRLCEMTAEGAVAATTHRFWRKMA